MADTKLADLASGAPAAATDLVYAVKDPSGTPTDAKLTLGEVKTLVVGAGSVSVASTKTLTASNTLTLAGTDGTTMTFPSTSATLAGLAIAQTFTAKQTIDLSGEQLALGGTNTGVFSLAGSTSGKVTIQAANAAGTYTLTLPTSDGDAGQFLKTDGSGVLSWDAAGGGGTPGGSDTQIQYNNAGAFAGASGITTNGTNLTLGSASQLLWSTDLILTRKNTRILQLGAADAATALAQTLSVQSVVAGTTNTAGANLTITGSQGTGTGAGGSIVFQVAPAGSSGTAQNALSTALTIAGTRAATFASSVTAASVAVSDLSWDFNTSWARFFTSSSGTLGVDFFSSRADATFLLNGFGNGIGFQTAQFGTRAPDLYILRDAANTLAQRNGANAQESRVYGSYTAADNFQRMSIKTLRESSGALSGATYVTTIAIPAYANLIGVTTRVTTAVTGATTYDVGDGSDVDLWGAAIGVTLGSQSRTADFTAVAAVGAAATSRTVTLTANGSNFTGGVIEICLHYLTTEAD
jgi:hypothetical protein